MSPRHKPVAPHATQSLIVSAGPVDPGVAALPVEPRGRLRLTNSSGVVSAHSGAVTRFVRQSSSSSSSVSSTRGARRRSSPTSSARNCSRSRRAALRISSASRSASPTLGRADAIEAPALLRDLALEPLDAVERLRCGAASMLVRSSRSTCSRVPSRRPSSRSPSSQRSASWRIASASRLARSSRLGGLRPRPGPGGRRRRW